MMTIDKSSLLSPDEVALGHYHQMLLAKIVSSWYEILKERGAIIRIRDKAFAAWKAYAPRKRKHRELTASLAEWQLLCVKAKAYRAMTLSCKGVIEQRTNTLYQIQQKSKDRKFLMCVFALTGHQANVIFLDCWRRWRKWISMRMSWRLAARQLRYEWANIKISTIFHAWRAMVSKHESVFMETKDVVKDINNPSSNVGNRKLSFFHRSNISDLLTKNLYGGTAGIDVDSDSDNSDTMILVEEESGERDTVVESKDGSLTAIPGRFLGSLF